MSITQEVGILLEKSNYKFFLKEINELNTGKVIQIKINQLSNRTKKNCFSNNKSLWIK